MALDQDLLFIAQKKELEIYNTQALQNVTIYFELSDGTIFNFPGFISAYLYVYQSRGETMLKSFTTQITRSANVLVLNFSPIDMTFENQGKYYYEIGYVQSGGYPALVLYGDFFVK